MKILKPNFLDMQFIRSIKVKRSLEILVILEVSRVIKNFTNSLFNLLALSG